MCVRAPLNTKRKKLTAARMVRATEVPVVSDLPPSCSQVYIEEHFCANLLDPLCSSSKAFFTRLLTKPVLHHIILLSVSLVLLTKPVSHGKSFLHTPCVLLADLLVGLPVIRAIVLRR